MKIYFAFLIQLSLISAIPDKRGFFNANPLSKLFSKLKPSKATTAAQGNDVAVANVASIPESGSVAGNLNGQRGTTLNDAASPDIQPAAVEVGAADDLHVHILPPETQLRILGTNIDNFKDFDFRNALQVSRQKGGNRIWAIEHHNPALDDYSMIDDWLRITDPAQKAAEKTAMLKNPFIAEDLSRLQQWIKEPFHSANGRSSRIHSTQITHLKHLIEPLDMMSSVSFARSQEIAAANNINPDWAVIFHDATRDNQAFLRSWQNNPEGYRSIRRIEELELIRQNPTMVSDDHFSEFHRGTIYG